MKIPQVTISVLCILTQSYSVSAFAPSSSISTGTIAKSALYKEQAIPFSVSSRDNKPLSRLMVTTTSEDIIPREVLFGNPNYASPMLSPDGEYLAFLAPSTDKGVLNVFVQKTSDIENIDNARMVTNDQSRGIRQAGWSPDSTTILFLQDFEAKDLTPGKDVKASNLLVNKRFKDEILVGTNERDATCFDMYRVNYKTGERTLDTKNPGDVLGWGSE